MDTLTVRLTTGNRPRSHPASLSYSVSRYRLLSTVVAIASVSGCTSTALMHSTVTVSSSVGMLLEQQVLENLSRFYDAPFSTPSQVVLSSGAVQVQNQLTSALKLPYTLTQKSSKEGDLGLNMQWQYTWTIAPVTDSEDLYRLQYLYRGAVVNLMSREKRPQESEVNQTYLTFDVGPLKFGASLTKCSKPAVPPAKSTSPPPQSDFENCEKMAALLSRSREWLAFDKPPEEVSDDASNLGDVFVEKRVYGGHHIWVRPREFSEFMLYVLFATPKSKLDASAKALPFSIPP